MAPMAIPSATAPLPPHPHQTGQTSPAQTSSGKHQTAPALAAVGHVTHVSVSQGPLPAWAHTRAQANGSNVFQANGSNVPPQVARNPKPETRNPEPETRNPKPGTRNPKPGIRNPTCLNP